MLCQTQCEKYFTKVFSKKVFWKYYFILYFWKYFCKVFYFVIFKILFLHYFIFYFQNTFEKYFAHHCKKAPRGPQKRIRLYKSNIICVKMSKKSHGNFWMQQDALVLGTEKLWHTLHHWDFLILNFLSYFNSFWMVIKFRLFSDHRPGFHAAFVRQALHDEQSRSA